jgi:hypothetical protein
VRGARREQGVSPARASTEPEGPRHNREAACALPQHAVPYTRNMTQLAVPVSLTLCRTSGLSVIVLPLLLLLLHGPVPGLHLLHHVAARKRSQRLL